VHHYLQKDNKVCNFIWRIAALRAIKVSEGSDADRFRRPT